MDDVRKSLFNMGPYKAPGSDGFQPVFFQQQWEIIGQDLYNFARGVFDGREDIQRVNETFLVLIPKIPNPDKLS